MATAPPRELPTITSGNRYAYFTCNTSAKQPGKGNCHQWRVLENEVEEIVLGHLVHEVDMKFLQSMEQKSREFHIVPQRGILQEKLNKLNQVIEVATDRWLKAPDVMMDAAEKKVREYQAEAKRLEDQIATINLQESVAAETGIHRPTPAVPDPVPSTSTQTGWED